MITALLGECVLEYPSDNRLLRMRLRRADSSYPDWPGVGVHSD
jgi:hypothetical protein